MKKYSTTNKYSTSSGEKFTRLQIESYIRAAKKDVLKHQFDVHGYNFCSVCKRNDCIPIDCSHIVPVSYCLSNGKAELAWDINNILPMGRKCHKIKDNLT